MKAWPADLRGLQTRSNAEKKTRGGAGRRTLTAFSPFGSFAVLIRVDPRTQSAMIRGPLLPLALNTDARTPTGSRRAGVSVPGRPRREGDFFQEPASGVYLLLS